MSCRANWNWWVGNDGDGGTMLVVGDLGQGVNGEEVPLVTVGSQRDANILVSILKNIDAEPVRSEPF